MSKSKKEERTGEISVNKNGTKMQIVEYTDALNLYVKFLDEHEYMLHTNYYRFKRGEVNNPFDKNTYGIGFLGLDYDMNDDNCSKAYDTWKNMLKRCYCDGFVKTRPTYNGCTVCNEWHNFSVFYRWYQNNFYQIDNDVMHLDKDILIKGNKIYSPETCVFVNAKINSLFAHKNSKLPIGVRIDKRNNQIFSTCYDINGKENFIGNFNNIEDAFLAYKYYKEKVIKDVADNYKDKIPYKLYKALYDYNVEKTD